MKLTVDTISPRVAMVMFDGDDCTFDEVQKIKKYIEAYDPEEKKVESQAKDGSVTLGFEFKNIDPSIPNVVFNYITCDQYGKISISDELAEAIKAKVMPEKPKEKMRGWTCMRVWTCLNCGKDIYYAGGYSHCDTNSLHCHGLAISYKGCAIPKPDSERWV